MLVNGKQTTPPTRADVENVLLALIDGSISREDAAEWASVWIRMEDPPIHDKQVWQALERISGADMITTDRPYLYMSIDFEEWLLALRSNDK